MTGKKQNEEQATRKLRVYDNKGDFTIEVPTEARITFGYFNPVQAETSKYNQYNGPGVQTMRTTALRIYLKERGEPETQLACFLGCNGFRDMSLGLNRLVNKVTVEQHYADNGEGAVDSSKRVRRQLVASTETDVYNGEDDIAF